MIWFPLSLPLTNMFGRREIAGRTRRSGKNTFGHLVAAKRTEVVEQAESSDEVVL